MLNTHVSIVEVGPRDGLQNAPAALSTKNKALFIQKIVDAGIRRIEVASFANPKRVPQMAGAEDVIASLPEHQDISYIGLVLNIRGAERALKTKISELGSVVVATDTFGQKNQGQTVEQGVQISNDITRLAKAEGRKGQVTIAAAFGCPFEGDVEVTHVIDIAKRLAEAEPSEIAVADTIGVAVPSQVHELLGRLKEEVHHIPVRAHFHNTRNTGIANAWAAIESGVDTLDASLGGMGGCPFAPQATGNIATEDLVYMLDRSGVTSGVDINRLISATNWLEKAVGQELPGLVSKAGIFPNEKMKSNAFQSR